MSLWIGTANQGYAPYAMEEIRKIIPGCGFKPLSPGEVFWMESPLDKDATMNALHGSELVFLRHIQPVEISLDASGDSSDLDKLADVLREASSFFQGKRAAVHLRKAAGSSFSYGASETKTALEAVLTEAGAEPDVQHPEVIFSIYASRDDLFAGYATPYDMLSDWPGGAVRFQREDGQISRAKFKLLEAERAFGLDYSQFARAIDIGAAPGGWTSLLLERGLNVTAVDPAELHSSLQGHPALRHLKINASEIKLEKGSYDLLVCDMSWSPMQMSRLVLDLRDSLAPGAKAIITVKLMHRKPLQSIREVKERLGTGFHILRSKQLFHNREEITLFAEKK
ncbi:SAM-dependent methyltransferase [Paenibacillus sp. CAU 1782]